MQLNAARPIEVVDVGVDPREARRARGRRLYRIGLPIVGVLLIAAGIGATSLYSYERNRGDALRLANDLITSVARRATLEVERYLGSAADAARIAAASAEDPFSAVGQAAFERAATELLRITPQIGMIYVGAANGNYLAVRRMEGGRTDVEHITNAPGAREVKWVRRNASGAVDRVDVVADEGYDPRTRPWYHIATEANEVAWTDAYIFFTDRKPGLTASLALRDESNAVRAVVGVDVRLDQIGTFLSGLNLGQSGRAMILDADGVLVAFSDESAVIRQEGNELRRVRPEELGDPVLKQVVDRLRISGPTQSVVEVRGGRYIVMSSSLDAAASRGWSLVLIVPERDFIGFVALNHRNALWLSLLVVALAVLLAGFLVAQGLATDRMARLVDRRQETMDAQSRAFEILGRAAAEFDPTDEAAARRVTETVAGATRAGRAALWQFDADREFLVCCDGYESATRGHVAGTRLHRGDAPRLFDAMRRGEEIAVADVSSDPLVARPGSGYFATAGMRCLLAVPIGPPGRAAGYLWLEYQRPGAVDPGARAFARAVAQMLAPRFTSLAWEEDPQAATETPVGPEAPRIDAVEMRTSSVVAEMAKLPGEVRFPSLAILVLRLSDDFVLAEPGANDRADVRFRQLVEFLRAASERYGIRYLKVSGAEISLAKGFDSDARDGARKLAEVALQARQESARLLHRAGGVPCFSIGLDFGAALGSRIGAQPSIFNVWGPTLRTAALMAETAAPGTIQATESIYREIGDRFMFRHRGGFFVENCGEMETYVLQARL